jgi:hypothetical protein
MYLCKNGRRPGYPVPYPEWLASIFFYIFTSFWQISEDYFSEVELLDSVSPII